jgi:porin
MNQKYFFGLMGGLACAIFTTPTFASEPESKPAFSWEAVYNADLIGPISGSATKEATFLDKLSIKASLDLEQTLGWTGASLHGQFLNNSGGAPNDGMGIADGIDNIEVVSQRAKLHEIYLDQTFQDGGLLFRIGQFDLNADFYVTDSSGLFINPAFGISAELSATGSAGPSIFPSTALGGMVRIAPSEASYAQLAVFDANAGNIGDEGGIPSPFKNGALVIGEAGWTGDGKVAFGLGGYTDKQDDLRDLDRLGAPAKATEIGAYVLVDRPIAALSEGDRKANAFLRLGVSSGRATPFSGGSQAGIYISNVFADRPDSQLGIGVRYASLSARSQANARDLGINPASNETGLEITYADNIVPWLTAQPSLQIINNPGGDADADTMIVAAVRFSVSFASP